jgi:16S rRNA (guanine527-N7)-methyltransferase
MEKRKQPKPGGEPDPWPEFARIASEGARALGVFLGEEPIRLLALHARELLIWNARLNLTAVADPQEMAALHYADSLAPAPWLRHGAAVLDLGAGGGFPGVPLAVARPDISMTLLDSARKKTSFLAHTAALMGLKNVRAVQARAEEAVLKGLGGQDAVVSRAVADLALLWRLAEPLLVPGGALWAMKGPRAREEAEELARASGPGIARVEFLPYALPEREETRFLVVVEKAG